MATTTELLAAVPSQSLMANNIFHQCRRPSPLSFSWAYGKRAQKRHSSSLSLYDISVLGSKKKETTSLPSTPIPFSSVEENIKKKRFWEDSDCIEEVATLFPCSDSSGYSSGYSSEDSTTNYSSGATYYQPSEESDYPNKENRTIPSEAALSSSPEINSQYPSISSCSRFDSSSPLSDSVSPSVGNSSPAESVPSKLISVSVPSKRTTSESSSSSTGSAIADDAPRLRVKDEEGFIRRAACVCVNEDESKVILISSKYEGGGWLIPGGGLESGEGETEAAVREAWEEAGIKGEVKRCLGVFQSEDESTRKKKRTAVYVLSVQEQHSSFPESVLGRSREWFTIDTAIHQLTHCKPHQIAYLRAL